jgi:hypothetical protein
MPHPVPTHPQQYVPSNGVQVPIEEFADIVMATTPGSYEQKVDATFRTIGRRLGLNHPTTAQARLQIVQPATAPQAPTVPAAYQAALDRCCRIAVKR